MQTLHTILHMLVLIALSFLQLDLCRRLLREGPDWILLAGAAAITALLTFLHFGVSLILHEGSHFHLARKRWLNESLFLASGYWTFMIPCLYRYLHWTHHSDPNTPEDWELNPETRIDLAGAERRRALRRLMLLGGLERVRIFAGIALGRHLALPEKLARRARGEMALLGAARIATVIVILALLGFPLGLSWILAGFAVPAFLGGWFAAWLQLTQHFGAASGRGHEVARDVEPRTGFQRILYRAMFNVNYHSLHHEDAGIPGHRLPEAYQNWLQRLRKDGLTAPRPYSGYLEAWRAMIPALRTETGRRHDI